MLQTISHHRARHVRDIIDQKESRLQYNLSLVFSVGHFLGRHPNESILKSNVPGG